MHKKILLEIENIFLWRNITVIKLQKLSIEDVLRDNTEKKYKTLDLIRSNEIYVKIKLTISINYQSIKLLILQIK